MPTTASHFWQMVWEQNSRVIIMLTHLIEKGCVSDRSALVILDFELMPPIRTNVGFTIPITKMRAN